MDKHTHKEQTVIAMSEYQPETGYPAVAQVEAYWEALRGNRLLPKRSEIDPRGIERALENAFILERVAPGIARLRIAGSHLNDLMGMEVRGMPLTALFTPNSRRDMADLLEEVFQAPACSTLTLRSESGVGGRPLDARMVLLPLKSDLGDVSRILGCLASKGDRGPNVRRFDILSHHTRHIAIDTHRPSRHLPSVVPPAAPLGLAETGTPFQGKPTQATQPARKAKRPPYLRLIKTDE